VAEWIALLLFISKENAKAQVRILALPKSFYSFFAFFIILPPVEKIDFPKMEFFEKIFIQRRSARGGGPEKPKNHSRKPKELGICLVNMR
jgi:hypothetical protein